MIISRAADRRASINWNFLELTFFGVGRWMDLTLFSSILTGSREKYYANGRLVVFHVLISIE